MRSVMLKESVMHIERERESEDVSSAAEREKKKKKRDERLPLTPFLQHPVS